jgi:hypothetical protein
MKRFSFFPALLFAPLFLLVRLSADQLTKQLEVDFGHDVASRNLKGLAARSDGRVLPGPVFTDLNGPKIADILWVLRSSGPNHFLVGTGPEGRVFEIVFEPKKNSYTVRETAHVTEAQAISLQPLAGGDFLIGTSPSAAVYLVHQDKLIARVPLPADSVFDFLALPDGSILASTGNPGRIYRLDPVKLAKAGMSDGKITDEKALAAKGVTLFGEVRDRNIRRLARLADGRVVAGSAPKGNIYAFGDKGGSPALLQENHDAEVVDLLPLNDGVFYAALVQSPGEGNRIVRAKPGGSDKDKDDSESRSSFSGRSLVVRFPVDGFPETVISRSGVAIYRLAPCQGGLLLSAGEEGDTFGYDPEARRSLAYAGSNSAELNDLVPLDANRFLVLRYNAPGLALVSFVPSEQRTLETKRLDLGVLGTLGMVRLGHIRGVAPTALQVEASINPGSDEVEGWSAWTKLKAEDDAFSAAGLRGRFLKLRLTVPADAADFSIDKAMVYYLPQNRRPQLNDFRIFPPNLALVPMPELPLPQSSTLGQLLFPNQSPLKDDNSDKHKNTFLNSQVVPQPGAQIIYWTVGDADGDNLAYTLSIRPESGDTWTDLAVDIRDSYLQFETAAFPEGVYLTRLAAKELAPRPEKERLSYTFETDYLIIDRTPPEITAATVEHRDGRLVVSVDGRDALSLLEGVEIILNNGVREQVEHPADGILDSKVERFVAEIPDPRASGATSVEIVLYDQAGNSSSKRLPIATK